MLREYEWHKSPHKKLLRTDLFIAEIFSKIMHHGAQFREGDKPGRLKGIENTFNPFNIPITVLIKDIKHLSDLSCSLNPLK